MSSLEPSLHATYNKSLKWCGKNRIIIQTVAADVSFWLNVKQEHSNDVKIIVYILLHFPPSIPVFVRVYDVKGVVILL